jgi:hypothetical protein
MHGDGYIKNFGLQIAYDGQSKHSKQTRAYCS